MNLHPARYFSSEPSQRAAAESLYGVVQNLPLVCPHGHVEPRLFSDSDYAFGSPVDLLIIPDHYVFRMLYSRGVPLESLGIPAQDKTPVETDHRRIWQTVAKHFYLFRGTPTGIWLADELERVFGITDKLDEANAQAIYDQIAEKLMQPDLRPRALYARFNIEVLCTTDAATDTLRDHQAIRDGWHGRILPTFRPDAVINLLSSNWRENIQQLREVTNRPIENYLQFVRVLEERRALFQHMGAVATDHAAPSAYTERMSDKAVERLFQAALRGENVSPDDARRFTGHMLIEMARMSCEDGLVMQLHVGSYRNHNEALYRQFGPDKGADIPLSIEFTQALKPLLDAHGTDRRLTLVLFTLDEATYSRELAPLAGHYPALRLGPPWWFHDSLNGMRRYFESVVETAGLYNTAGFNDDTRAFLSIPARHDVWRRASCDWLAGLVVRHIIDMSDAESMARACAYELAKETYKL